MKKSPEQIMDYARRFCKGLRATQAANFVALCDALALLRTCILSRLAGAISGPQRHCHRLKRLWRLVSNPRFPAKAVMDAICLHNFKAALSIGARRIVLLDFTALHHPFSALVAAVPIGGRAVPLLLWPCIPSEFERSQNTFVEEMLAHLKGLIGDFTLVADRGFGHEQIIRACRILGIAFVLRIRSDVIMDAGTRIAPAGEFAPRHGARYYPNALYGKQHKEKVNFVAVASGTDPWLLITSLSDMRRARALYRRRMEIEQSFKDIKSYLNLDKAMVRTVERLLVIATAVMAVHSFFLWLGFVASRSPLAAKLICSGTEKAGYVFIAINLLLAFPSLLGPLYQRMGRLLESG
ncbi:MAG: transposase [Armatimonadetes bacterium]|nr:transposase [Armatimonadota bacterium]